eukprot:7456902-Alexandrium_andersonii.AAC.1
MVRFRADRLLLRRHPANGFRSTGAPTPSRNGFRSPAAPTPPRNGFRITVRWLLRRRPTAA